MIMIKAGAHKAPAFFMLLIKTLLLLPTGTILPFPSPPHHKA
jgi:hypothetical protein